MVRIPGPVKRWYPSYLHWVDCVYSLSSMQSNPIIIERSYRHCSHRLLTFMNAHHTTHPPDHSQHFISPFWYVLPAASMPLLMVLGVLACVYRHPSFC